jgi:hypothetical protein
MGVYIDVFRSRQFYRDEVCDVWAHEAKDHLYHAGNMWAHVFPSLLVLVAFLIEFFFSRSSISRKNNAAKRLGPFDIRKVPETKKNTQNRVFLYKVKYQINGDFVENPQT